MTSLKLTFVFLFLSKRWTSVSVFSILLLPVSFTSSLGFDKERPIKEPIWSHPVCFPFTRRGMGFGSSELSHGRLRATRFIISVLLTCMWIITKSLWSCNCKCRTDVDILLRPMRALSAFENRLTEDEEKRNQDPRFSKSDFVQIKF